MEIKFLIDEDFINYKKPSMFIGFPYCTFKCNKDCGRIVCQNYKLLEEKNYIIPEDDVVIRYLNNPITEAIVFGGLEPFDSFDDMLELVYCIREKTSCDIVIYTGYDKDEIINKVKMLSGFGNIIVKFGRYIPDDTPHYDDLLGITLSSSNQYAEEIL